MQDRGLHSAHAATLIAIVVAAMGAGLLGGAGQIHAAASGRLSPMAKNTMIAPPHPIPGDCSSVLSHDQANGATKTFVQSLTFGTTTTYFFSITSTRPDGTETLLEDCAYANGDPSNIKYSVQAANPPFAKGQVFTTITAASGESICDRTAITNKDGSVDYTNLVGSSAGKVDPSACQQNQVVPEAPSVGLTALAGLGVTGGAALIWRRRTLRQLTRG